MNADDLGLNADVEIEAGLEAFGTLEKEVFTLGDLASNMVG